MAAILARATRISDGMLVAATKKLASLSPYEKTGSLLPSFADSRDINLQVALAVWSAAIDEGLATSKVDGGEAERKEFALAYQWSQSFLLSNSKDELPSLTLFVSPLQLPSIARTSMIGLMERSDQSQASATSFSLPGRSGPKCAGTGSPGCPSQSFEHSSPSILRPSPRRRACPGR